MQRYVPHKHYIVLKLKQNTQFTSSKPGIRSGVAYVNPDYRCYAQNPSASYGTCQVGENNF